MKKTSRLIALRIGLALTLCLLYSGFIGPRIIDSGWLYKYHFDVYGGLGKVLLFFAAVLVLLLRAAGNRKDRKDSLLVFAPFTKKSFGWLAMSMIYYGAAWICLGRLLLIPDAAWWALALHISLSGSVVMALIGIFDLKSLRQLSVIYRRELLLAALFSLAFYCLLAAAYAAWCVLAAAVLNTVSWLLTAVSLSADIVPPLTLKLAKFSVSIGQTCSGVESLALFGGLYAAIGFMDWQRFNRKKYFLLLPFAMFLLFCINILRVFALILVGYYIDRQLAFNLFHTYASMVLFIIYCAVFWKISYRWMLRKKTTSKCAE